MSHKYSISAKLRIEPGSLWLEGKNLTNYTNHACPIERIALPPFSDIIIVSAAKLI